MKRFYFIGHGLKVKVYVRICVYNTLSINGYEQWGKRKSGSLNLYLIQLIHVTLFEWGSTWETSNSAYSFVAHPVSHSSQTASLFRHPLISTSLMRHVQDTRLGGVSPPGDCCRHRDWSMTFGRSQQRPAVAVNVNPLTKLTGFSLRSSSFFILLYILYCLIGRSICNCLWWEGIPNDCREGRFFVMVGRIELADYRKTGQVSSRQSLLPLESSHPTALCRLGFFVRFQWCHGRWFDSQLPLLQKTVMALFEAALRSTAGWWLSRRKRKQAKKKDVHVPLLFLIRNVATKRTTDQGLNKDPNFFIYLLHFVRSTLLWMAKCRPNSNEGKRPEPFLH